MLVAGVEVPDDIFSVLLDWLTVPDLAAVQLVCKELHTLANDQSHWFNRCRRQGLVDMSASMDAEEDWKEYYKHASAGGYLYICSQSSSAACSAKTSALQNCVWLELHNRSFAGQRNGVLGSAHRCWFR